jgi:hypothetical protein
MKKGLVSIKGVYDDDTTLSTSKKNARCPSVDGANENRTWNKHYGNARKTLSEAKSMYPKH